MSDSTLSLLSPVQVGPYSLANRMVMAPLTRNRAGPGNVPTALMIEYYAQRAGAGLIVSEGSQVSPQGVGYLSTPGIHSPEQVEGWRRVTSAVYAKGGRMFLQLWHVGRISHPSLQPAGAPPVAPSPVKPAGQVITYTGVRAFEMPRALKPEEIPGVVEQYRQGARNALEAGFDGVEIHSASGYLLDQFLRDGSNRRADGYGGPVENRARLLLEVVAAVCDVWGADRVGVRISPLQAFNDMYDSDPEATFSYVVEQLNVFDLAYLHVTEMGAETPDAAGPAFDLRQLRRLFRGVYIANGGYNLARGNATVQAGDADLIAFGVLFIANPDLPQRFARNAPLNKPDQSTFYGGGAEGYTDYASLEE